MDLCEVPANVAYIVSFQDIWDDTESPSPKKEKKSCPYRHAHRPLLMAASPQRRPKVRKHKHPAVSPEAV